MLQNIGQVKLFTHKYVLIQVIFVHFLMDDCALLDAEVTHNVLGMQFSSTYICVAISCNESSCSPNLP